MGEAGPSVVLVDPTVSHRKFERDLRVVLSREQDYRRRGIFIIESAYPEVFVVFAQPTAWPNAVLFGALIDFANYDLWPPSVRLVNAFTKEPYTPRSLPRGLGLYRIEQGENPGELRQRNFLQSWADSDKPPFVCMAGVREYHHHPAHTGDSWLMHRERGEGTLEFVLEKLYDHGVAPIANFQVQISIGGLLYDPGKMPV